MPLRVLCLVSMCFFIHARCPAADIAFVIEQVGPDVIATGSGSMNLSGLTSLGNFPIDAQVNPNAPDLVVGSGTSTWYILPSGTASGSIGSGSSQVATLSAGQKFGINSSGILYVPDGYTSGSPLTGGATWTNTTLAAMGLTVGSSWTYSWNSNARSISISVVPEPSSIATGIVAASVMGLVLRRRRK